MIWFCNKKMFWYNCSKFKKPVGAVLFNYLRIKDCWCKYQADKINNANICKSKPGIPTLIKDKIKLVFVDLSDDRLLSKCLYGKTQNNNKVIKSIIWNRLPKKDFVVRQTLEYHLQLYLTMMVLQGLLMYLI